MTDECFADVLEEIEGLFEKTLKENQRRALYHWMRGYHDDDVRTAKNSIVQNENQRTFWLPATWKKYLPQQAKKPFRQNDEPIEGTYSIRYSTLAMKILSLQAAKIISESYAQQMLRLAMNDQTIGQVESEEKQLRDNRVAEMMKNEPMQIAASLGKK